jgi:hypothetical protein
VLGPGLGAHLRDELLADQPTHQRPGQHAIQKARPAWLRLPDDQFARRGFGVGRKYQSVHEPRTLRLVGTQRLAGQHHLHGRTHAGAPHGAHRATESRVDAEHDLGQADGKFVAVDTDAIAACQRELEAATQSKAIDDRYRGAGERFYRVEDALRTSDQLESLFGAGELRKLLHVGTGDEASRLGRADHHAFRTLTFQRLDVAVELDHGVARQHVGGGPGLVEGQPRDPIGIGVDAPGTRLPVFRHVARRPRSATRPRRAR